MKSKTKFDPKVIQQFFIDHTEKFVVGLIAALFLFFAYQLLHAGNGYEKKPEDSSRPPTPPWARSPAVHGNEEARGLVDFGLYADDIDGAKKPIDPSSIRSSPHVLEADRTAAAPRIAGRFCGGAVAGHSGRGAIPSATNGDSAGKRWIIITGLVPYEKQLAEYRTSSKEPPGTILAKTCPSTLATLSSGPKWFPAANPIGRSS